MYIWMYIYKRRYGVTRNSSLLGVSREGSYVSLTAGRDNGGDE